MSEKTKILIADDHPTNQFALTTFLKRKYDAELLTCQNGKEALDLIQKHQVKLILLDMMMPVMSGYDFLHQLRSSEEKTIKDIPVIAITANAMEGDKDKCLESGATDYLSKPFEFDEAYDMIDKYIMT